MCERLSKQISGQAKTHYTHTRTHSLCKHHLGKADHNDERPWVNLLHSGQRHLGSGTKWPPVCPHKGSPFNRLSNQDTFRASVYARQLSALSAADITALPAAPKTETLTFNKMFTACDLVSCPCDCCVGIFMDDATLWKEKIRTAPSAMFPSVSSHWFWLLVPPSGRTVLACRGLRCRSPQSVSFPSRPGLGCVLGLWAAGGFDRGF